MNCSKCGAQVASTDAFCASCGNPVGFETPAGVNPADPTPPASGGTPPDAGATPPPPPPAYAPAPPPPPPGASMPPPMAPPAGGYQPYRFQDPVSGAPTAEWWQRAVALIIDWLIIGIPSIIFFLILASATKTTSTDVFGNSYTRVNRGAEFLGYIVILAAYGLYYVLLNGSERGQTVGKMVMGIAVKDENGTQPIGYGRAAGRFGIVFVCNLCFIPEILNYLWPLWDVRRQCWHDKVAHSLVVNVR
jgi:uncharacterized RDD family membrane protein YckC